MTARQLDFIKRLAEERKLEGDRYDEEHGRKAAYVAKVVTGEASPDTGAASRIIEWLMELPMRASRQERTRAPRAREAFPEVPEGRYALRHVEGAVSDPAFYKIDRPTEGRWAGYTFVNEQSGENRLPIRDDASKRAILERIAEDPIRAAKLYGTELGHCARCGRELTDDTSRAFGIGPDCREAWGV